MHTSGFFASMKKTSRSRTNFNPKDIREISAQLQHDDSGEDLFDLGSGDVFEHSQK